MIAILTEKTFQARRGPFCTRPTEVNAQTIQEVTALLASLLELKSPSDSVNSRHSYAATEKLTKVSAVSLQLAAAVCFFSTLLSPR